MTKVHLAAHGGLASIITEYIRQNQDVDIRDSKGRTPLAYAAKARHLDTTRVLLESKRVNSDSKDKDDRTPLLLAALTPHRARPNIQDTSIIIQLLLQNGADPNTTVCGQTPLFFVAANGHDRIVKLLLDWRAKLDHQAKLGQRPILWAASKGFEANMEILIEMGANVTVPTTQINHRCFGLLGEAGIPQGKR